MGDDDRAANARTTASEVARRSYGKLVAFVASRTRDVAAAEDALADAFAAALADWPVNGCPTNPEAWLLAVARRKAVDGVRRQRSRDQAAPELAVLAESQEMSAAEHTVFPDHRLALMFACTHPAIDAATRAPLMLQVVLGLDAATIASAFLVSPATMGQRLVRAKNKIREAGIPFRTPEPGELPHRLSNVLDAIYAAFAEGWVDPTQPARRDLAEEALFLGQLIVELLPREPEALGLLALMSYADARRAARRDANGCYVPLAEQDPRLWNEEMIDDAETFMRRASALGRIGRYQLEGAIQSAHVHRRRSGSANWPAIVGFYDALFELSHSPVVAINRALAIAEAQGARAGFAALEAIAGDARLAQYQPYWAARAQLLARTGAATEACHAYDIAIGLERDSAVRQFLQRQKANVAGLSARPD